MTIALFFPATTVAAATAWKEELEQQIASFQHALAQIGADVQGEVQNRVIRWVAMPNRERDTGKLGVVAGFRVDANAMQSRLFLGPMR